VAAAFGVTSTVTAWRAVSPPGVVAMAVSVIAGGATGTRTTNTPASTAAGTPLTVTPGSPPAETVPRTSSGPSATVVPAGGSVMKIRRRSTAKPCRTGVGSSLPARSRAFTSKV
jgi:hypothetical protein